MARAGTEPFVPPVAEISPAEGRVGLRFTREPGDVGLTRVLFPSPVTLDFVDTRLLSVDVLDTPELLRSATLRVPCVAWDTGWVWITLMDGAHPTWRWTGSAEVEVAVGGSTLVSVDLDLCREIDL